MSFPLMPIAIPQRQPGSLVGSGSFTVPLGVTSVSFTIRGGGGGRGGNATAAGSGDAPQTGYGGGGGNGATVVGTIAVTTGDVIVATLGAVGTAGTNVTISSPGGATGNYGSSGTQTVITKNGITVATASPGIRGVPGSCYVSTNGFNSASNGPGGAGGTTGTGGTVTAGANGVSGSATNGADATSTITW